MIIVLNRLYAFLETNTLLTEVVDIGVETGGGGGGGGGALGTCVPPIFWVTNINIIPQCPSPQSDKMDCRLVEGIKVLFKQPLKVSI